MGGDKKVPGLQVVLEYISPIIQDIDIHRHKILLTHKKSFFGLESFEEFLLNDRYNIIKIPKEVQLLWIQALKTNHNLDD